MNTIAFVVAGCLIVLVIMAKIPGLDYLIRPVIELVFSFLKLILEHFWSWTIWLLKALTAAHIEIFRNLTKPAEELDPSQVVRNKEKKQ